MTNSPKILISVYGPVFYGAHPVEQTVLKTVCSLLLLFEAMCIVGYRNKAIMLGFIQCSGSSSCLSLCLKKKFSPHIDYPIVNTGAVKYH